MSFKKKPDLVSIVMVTCNRAKLISISINSLIKQSYKNFELIIIDCSSSGETGKIISRFNDSRIRYFRKQPDPGLAKARNIGIGIARGKYLCFLDDDDELFPKALDTCVNEFEKFVKNKFEVGSIWFDCVDVQTKNKTGRGLAKEGYISYESYLCEKISGEFFPFFDASLLKKFRFNEDVWGAEGLLWLKFLKSHRIYYVPEVIRIYHREHGGNISNFEKQIVNSEKLLRGKKVSEHFIRNNMLFLEYFGDDQRSICPKIYGRRLAILSLWQSIKGDFSVGRKTSLRSLKYLKSPFTMGTFLYSMFPNKKLLIRLYRLTKLIS